MKPVRTTRSNFVYRGPTPEIGDLWVERQPDRRVVNSSWVLEGREIEALASGEYVVELGIHGMEPIPPVSLTIMPAKVVTDDEPPQGDLRGVFEHPEFSGISHGGYEGARPPKPPPPPRDREVG